MPILHRYLLRELLTSFLFSFVVLLLVSLSGVLADLLGRIARGRFPAALLFTQLGLRLVDVLAMLLTLSLFLGVLWCFGRLYRDSEMAVLASTGVGLRRLLRPVLWFSLPLVFIIGALSLWAGPAALALSKQMIDSANRSLLVAGLEPGRFVELPGRQIVVYLGDMSSDGSLFKRLFVHAEREDGRIDLITARAGELYTESIGDERYLRLTEGFQVEGVPGQDDYRVMRFERNDIRLPDSEPDASGNAEQRRDSLSLWRDDATAAHAELHWRWAAPLTALILVLLAVPLARTPPRAARYGRVLLALLAYLIYLSLLQVGRALLVAGTVPDALGLWWVHGPFLIAAVWLWRQDERLAAPRSRT